MGQFRQALSTRQPNGIEPEDLWQLTEELAYQVEISWAAASKRGRYDVLFKPSSHTGNVQLPIEQYQLSKSWFDYANNPLQSKLNQTLVPQLRQFLQQQLPEYMVPSTFVMLDAIPLTPNGKIDRLALPSPESRFKTLEEGYVAPRTPTEYLLAAIWAEVLGFPKVGIFDNFFELGGHSLVATGLVLQIRDRFSVEMPVRNLFEFPTVAALAEVIEQTRLAETETVVTPNVIDLNAEAILEATIQSPTAPLVVSEPTAILLTGATGFLGAYLVYELLVQTTADLYCLVRCSNVVEGRQRLQSTLESYSLWSETFRSRIIPVAGDLSESRLGIPEPEFRRLAKRIEVIYHNGAWVHHVYPYSVLKAANVLGTQEVLRLASQFKPKPVHFISTLGVFFHQADAGIELEIVSESDWIEDGRVLSQSGYIQSKWVAEQLVRQAGERGLPIGIYRLARIGGHSQTGISNSSDFLNLAIKGCIQLGKVPVMDEMKENITPVDYVSGAIVHLSRQTNFLGKTFHLVNPEPVLVNDLIQWIRSSGYPIEQISYAEWRTELSHQPENALYPLLSLLPQENSDDQLPKTVAVPQIEGQNTLDRLAGSELVCPKADAELFRLYFSYFWKSGFLESLR